MSSAVRLISSRLFTRKLVDVNGCQLAGLLARLLFNTFPSSSDSGLKIEQLWMAERCTWPLTQTHSYGDSTGFAPVSLFIPTPCVGIPIAPQMYSAGPHAPIYFFRHV